MAPADKTVKQTERVLTLASLRSYCYKRSASIYSPVFAPRLDSSYTCSFVFASNHRPSVLYLICLCVIVLDKRNDLFPRCLNLHQHRSYSRLLESLGFRWMNRRQEEDKETRFPRGACVPSSGITILQQTPAFPAPSGTPRINI